MNKTLSEIIWYKKKKW